MFELDRRRFLTAASALAGSAYFGSARGDEVKTAPAFAEKSTFDPNALFLTWQRDPTTTMTIQWIGAPEEGATRPIWYSKAGSMDWKQAPAVARPFPMPNLKVFRTELTGLEPGTDYHFRVGLDSAERKFQTAPAKANNTIQFVSGGDSGIGTAAMQTNEIAAKQSPLFVMMGGDLAYENGVAGGVFLQFLKNYSKQLVDDKRRMIPLIACIGNHEVRGSYNKTRKDAPYYYSVFDGLYSETGYATLDFGDYLSLVLLDSNHTTPIAGEQASWLEKTLKEREQRDNVFAFYHVPSYPSVRPVDLSRLSEAESGTGGASRKHWVPIFERYNIDAVFEHHDHAYKRTHPLMDGRIDSNGIPYLGDGSWGQIRRPTSPKHRPYLAVAHEAYHVSVHRVEGNQRFHVALSDKGKIVDVCMTKKRTRKASA